MHIVAYHVIITDCLISTLMERKPTVLELVNSLKSLVNWTTFAQNLPQIKEYHIDKIKAENKDDIDEQKRALYNKWLAVYPEAKFSDVINALEKSEQKDLAKRIKEEIEGGARGGASGGVAGTTATNDLSKIQDTLKLVLDRNFVKLQNATKNAIKSIAAQLFSKGIITNDVREKAEYEKIIDDFKSNLEQTESREEVQEICGKFLSGIASQGGPTRTAANRLSEEWKKQVKEKHKIELHFDQWYI